MIISFSLCCLIPKMWCNFCLFVISIIKLRWANTIPIISQQWPWGFVASPIDPGRCRLECLFLPLKTLQKVILGNYCDSSMSTELLICHLPWMKKKYFCFFFNSALIVSLSAFINVFWKCVWTKVWFRTAPERNRN